MKDENVDNDQMMDQNSQQDESQQQQNYGQDESNMGANNGDSQDESGYNGNGNGNGQENGASQENGNGDEANKGSNNGGSLEPEQFRKVFIGGLSYKTDDDALKAYFSKYGELVDHVVMKDGQTGRSRGFGFVTYSSSSMVDELMKNRPHIIDGRQVEPKRATPREDSGKQEVQMTVKKIFIGGLRDTITDDELKAYFSNYGNVTECLVMRDKETNKSRGFGFITYDDYDPVDKIILEKHHTVNGVTLHIQKALPKDADGNQRQGGGGGAGGGFNRGGPGGNFRNQNFGGMPNNFNGGYGGGNFGGPGNFQRNGGGFNPMGGNNRNFNQNGGPNGNMMMRNNNPRGGGGMGGGMGGGPMKGGQGRFMNRSSGPYGGGGGNMGGFNNGNNFNNNRAGRGRGVGRGGANQNQMN